MTETVLTVHNQNGNVPSMNLTNYAVSKGGTGTLKCPVLESVAKKAGCSAGTLYQIALGNKQPSAKLANEIHRATRGRVQRGELRPDVFGAPPATAANEAPQSEAAA